MSNHDLIIAMVGREISQLFLKKEAVLGEELLRVEGLGRTGYYVDVFLSEQAMSLKSLR